MTSFAEQLAQMDEAYAAAEAKGGGAAIPDGDYEAQIERFDFWNDNGQKPLKLITELSVVDGDYAGQKAPSVWHDLEDPDRLGWTKGYLELLGLEGVRLSELETRMGPVVGTRVGIRVVTKNGYHNTYVNEVLEQGDTFAPEPGANDEDDVTF